jgi:hypothetical protein
MDIKIHVFLTSVLVGWKWSASRPCRFTPPPHSHRYPLDKLGGPQIRSGRYRKHVPKSKLLCNWRSVSQSWYRSPLWDLRPDVTSCRNVAVWNLRSCFCGAPSLTRGRVCNLQCTHSMVRLVWDCPNLEGQVPVFISPRNRVAHRTANRIFHISIRITRHPD